MCVPSSVIVIEMIEIDTHIAPEKFTAPITDPRSINLEGSEESALDKFFAPQA